MPTFIRYKQDTFDTYSQCKHCLICVFLCVYVLGMPIVYRLFFTKSVYCDFVLWTNKDTNIE